MCYRWFWCCVYPTVILWYFKVNISLRLSNLFLLLSFACSRARSGKNACQKVMFIWAIRDTGTFILRPLLSRLWLFTSLDYLHWIANNLALALDNIPPTISVVVQLNITGVAATAQGLDESLKDSCSEVMLTPDSQSYSTILQSPFVQVVQGRPNLKQLISNEIDEATGKVSINGLYFKFTNCILSVEPKNIYLFSSLWDPITGQWYQNCHSLS